MLEVVHKFILAAFGKLFPYERPAETSIYIITEEDKKELSRWKLKATPIMLVLLAAISCIFMYVFYSLSRFSTPDENFQFFIRPSVIAWALPALFMGFAIILPVMDEIERRHFRERFDLMQHIYNSMYHWDALKISRVITVTFVALCFTSYFLLQGYSVKLDSEHIYYNPLFGLKTKVYDYADIHSIHLFNERNILGRFEIQFNDSAAWNSGWGLEMNDNKELLEFISKKSSQPMDTVFKK